MYESLWLLIRYKPYFSSRKKIYFDRLAQPYFLLKRYSRRKLETKITIQFILILEGNVR